VRSRECLLRYLPTRWPSWAVSSRLAFLTSCTRRDSVARLSIARCERRRPDNPPPRAEALPFVFNDSSVSILGMLSLRTFAEIILEGTAMIASSVFARESEHRRCFEDSFLGLLLSP
jgi:hypothetical protein